MKLCGGHIEEEQGAELRSQLMSWFESTKPFLLKRGFLSSHQLRTISTFNSEIKVEIKKKKKKRSDLYGLVFLECVLTKALQRESFSQQ